MDGWDEYYECVDSETGRQMEKHLHRFAESLDHWLHGTINWPTRDWEVQLQHLVDHTRYYGLEIHPVSIQSLHNLVDARVDGTGPFEALGPYRWDEPAVATGEPIQLAVAVGVNDGTRTDAPVVLAEEAAPATKDGVEVAGPGPETAGSFQEKVRMILELIDPDVADWWKQSAGVIRARDASSWTTFLLQNHYSTVENDRPLIVVDKNYTAEQTAAAIVDEARRGSATSIHPHFVKHWLATGDTAGRLGQLQRERFQEGAAFAAWAAELYYNAIGSLTPAGDVIVTVDDVGQHGLRWDHLLVVLPLMTHVRKGLKRLIVKLPGGRQLQLSGDLLERLRNLDAAEHHSLIAKARSAKTEEEGLAIIERGVAGHGKSRARPGKTPPGKSSTESARPVVPRRAQVHHPISTRVYRALENHPKLKGKYRPRDPRFRTTAIDSKAHHGYEEWHRDLDREAVDWINRNRDATEEAFETWLRARYSQDDLKRRFPMGI